jgi:hypothetical protein
MQHPNKLAILGPANPVIPVIKNFIPYFMGQILLFNSYIIIVTVKISITTIFF